MCVFVKTEPSAQDNAERCPAEIQREIQRGRVAREKTDHRSSCGTIDHHVVDHGLDANRGKTFEDFGENLMRGNLFEES